MKQPGMKQPMMQLLAEWLVQQEVEIQKAWAMFNNRYPGLVAPVIGSTKGEYAFDFYFCWSLPYLYVQIEFYSDGRMDWFGTDRDGVYDGTKDDLDTELPPEFWTWLSYVPQVEEKYLPPLNRGS